MYNNKFIKLPQTQYSIFYAIQIHSNNIWQRIQKLGILQYAYNIASQRDVFYLLMLFCTCTSENKKMERWIVERIYSKSCESLCNFVFT